jgi:hypothetical protein
VTEDILPDDDAQARYFGLVVLALHDIAAMQKLGLMTMPYGAEVMDDDEANAVIDVLEDRGFCYSDGEIAEKGWELILQWQGYYEVRHGR